MSLPSDDTILLITNENCSKSRATRALLEERGVAFESRAYLERPLDRQELEDLGARLGRPVGDWVRCGEGIEVPADEGACLDAIAANPILLQRPILVRGQRAADARFWPRRERVRQRCVPRRPDGESAGL